MTSAARRIVAEAVSLGVQIGWVADLAVEPGGVSVMIPGRHVTGRPAAIAPYSRCAWADRDELAVLLPPSRVHQITRAIRSQWDFNTGSQQGPATLGHSTVDARSRMRAATGDQPTPALVRGSLSSGQKSAPPRMVTSAG